MATTPKPLTDNQIEALKRALATARVHHKNQAPIIDSHTDDPTILDPLHAERAKEQRGWEELQEMLDDAEGVVIHPRE